MAVEINGPVELSGVSAAFWFLRLLRDPLQTVIESHKAYGPFIRLPHPRLYNKWPRQFIVAIGANFNRAILGDPVTWRPVSLGPVGAKNSAARRLSMGIMRMQGRQHAHHQRLIVPMLSSQSIDAMGDEMVGVAADEVAS
jgi:hypothetical protein